MNARGGTPLERHSERPYQRRNRLLAAALTAGLHVIVIAALIWPRLAPRHPLPAQPLLQVNFADLPKPTPPSPPSEAMKFTDMAPPRLIKPVFTIANTPDTSDLLSEAQIAGAAIAGEGSRGGGCDMAAIVQQALRRDPMVRASVEEAHRMGKAIMLWNGDWVRTGDQDGKGLSAVREAIIWEVAFAPEACRNMRVRGLVLLSLADNATRFAVGSGEWRWSDLLGIR